MMGIKMGMGGVGEKGSEMVFGVSFCFHCMCIGLVNRWVYNY